MGRGGGGGGLESVSGMARTADRFRFDGADIYYLICGRSVKSWFCLND